ncbi:MAG: Ku protein [Acidobacteriota bacterium]
MPRPLWEGHITFGLVNVPISLYTAESRSELQLHLLDSKDMARIKYKRVNEVTGEEVPGDRIVKAYEQDNGAHVVLTDSDFENADVEATQAIEIESFVERDSIDTTYFDRPYYLVPGKKGEKGYVLLRETLKRVNKVGIAKVVIKTRQYLAALIAQGDALILNLLRYAYELRDLSEYKLPGSDLAEYKITSRELDLAISLVNTMAAPWEPEKYRDEYHDALLAWIERKANEGAEVQPPEPQAKESKGVVVDFMDLLKKSVEQSEKARKQAGETGREKEHRRQKRAAT